MKKSSKYILISAFIVWHILPYLLQIVILQASKHSLSSIVSLLCQGIGLVSLIGLGYLALKKKGIEKKTELLYVGLYFIAFVLARLAIRGPITKIDSVGLRLGLGLGLFVIAVLLISSAFMRGLCKIKVTLAIVGLVILYFVGNTIISVGFEILPSNVITQVLCMVLLGLLEGIIFNKCFDYVSKKEPEREFKEENYKIKLLPALVVSVLCVISILGMIPGTRPAAMMVEIVENRMKSSMRYLAKGDISTAIEEYNTTLDYINVLRYVSDIEYDDSRLRKALETDELTIVKYLVWEKEEKYWDLENHYNTVQKDINVGIPLLDYYSNLSKESKNKESFERDYRDKIQGIIGQMISENEFVNPMLSVKDIEKKGKYFEKKFEDYVSAENFLALLQTLETIGLNEEITYKEMEKLLECANNEPENLFIQLITATVGISYKVDNAKHYEGTAGCIERIVTICEEDLDMDKKEVYTWSANGLIEIGYYDKALEYVDWLLQNEESEENILLAAFCKHKLGLNDECIEMVSRLPEDNYNAIYYRATSMIQEGRNNEALEEMIKLCEIMESNTEKKSKIENLLFELVQKSVIKDWTPAHQYGFYEPENEELVVLVGKNEILKQYMDAMYYCYKYVDYEEAEKAIERVLELDNELIEASYLAGIIHMEMEKYEDSIAYLEKTLVKNPEDTSALRVLSNVYDKMGNYEAAYEISKKIRELVPSTDHNFDTYGIGYHNNQLLYQLEKELGIEK